MKRPISTEFYYYKPDKVNTGLARYSRKQDEYINYLEQQLKILNTPVVVGQSEQLNPEFPEDRCTKHQEG